MSRFSLTPDEIKEVRSRISQTPLNFNICESLKTVDKKSEKKSILLVDSLSSVQVVQLALRHDIEHILQNSYQGLNEKLEIVNKLDADYKLYFDTSYSLLRNPIKKQLFKFFSITDRHMMIEKIFQFLELDLSSHRTQGVLKSLDEMIMNVQITARDISKSNENSVAQILVEKNEDLIGFSVFDSYGLLNVKKFLMKIESVLNVGVADSINFGKGGAGIGASLIFDNAESLFLGCVPNEITRVSALIPYGKSEKKLFEVQKSLNIVAKKI